VAISAPSALAVRTAESRGITLVGIARGRDFEIFGRPARIALYKDGRRPIDQLLAPDLADASLC
jgi:FdhD protein